MSGLEITGVVLGAIPLIISALEHYSNGIQTLQYMKNYAIVFEDYSIQLTASIGIYNDTCRDLIGPLNLPDDQMIALLKERKEEAWAATSLQTELKARLGQNHGTYVSLQHKLNKRIQLLCHKLRLSKDGQPPWIDSVGIVDEKARKRFFKGFWLRTKGGLNTQKYGVLLAEIDRDIGKLSKLTTGAIRNESNIRQRRELKDRLQSAYWQEIRDAAQRISDKLRSSLSPCVCTHSHQASLRLDLRENCDAGGVGSRFAFLLTFAKYTNVASPLPWRWRDIEIECSRLASSATAVTVPQVQTSGTVNAHSVPTISISPPSQPPLLHSQLSTSATKIDSLCQELVATHGQSCCLGVLEDGSWQHHIYSVKGPTTKAQIPEPVSLNDIIHDSRKLGTQQKCILALTLASSVLQLYDTPWLPRQWETKDIFFLKTSDRNMVPSQYYIPQTFASASQVGVLSKRRRLVQNEVVFSLGMALLELAYGSPIISLREPEDLGEDGKVDSTTEFAIASRLARDLYKLESENYARAVMRCITCTFDTSASDFSDQGFREAFYQAVVVPLQEDYQYVTGRKG